MSRVEHVGANLSLVAVPLASKDEFSRLFERESRREASGNLFN